MPRKKLEINKRLKAQIALIFGTAKMFSKKTGEPEAIVSKVVHYKYNLTDHRKAKWAAILNCETDIFDKPVEV